MICILYTIQGKRKGMFRIYFIKNENLQLLLLHNYTVWKLHLTSYSLPFIIHIFDGNPLKIPVIRRVSNSNFVARNCTQLFSNCAQFLGVYRVRNCTQVKFTCVGNPCYTLTHNCFKYFFQMYTFDSRQFCDNSKAHSELSTIEINIGWK